MMYARNRIVLLLPMTLIVCAAGVEYLRTSVGVVLGDFQQDHAGKGRWVVQD